VEVLVYCDNHEKNLEEALTWIEQRAGSGAFSLPGIVFWCSKCRKTSIISYEHYTANLPANIEPISSGAYYTRMCVGAEMLMQMQPS
jgi:hypothetical protein